jgi:hypothetical protein
MSGQPQVPSAQTETSAPPAPLNLNFPHGAQPDISKIMSIRPYSERLTCFHG